MYVCMYVCMFVFIKCFLYVCVFVCVCVYWEVMTVSEYVYVYLQVLFVHIRI
jgi:hypothetical protein